MGKLESELNRFSQAIFCEPLEEVRDCNRVLELLRQGLGPLSLTLRYNPGSSERQALVLQEVRDESVLIFEPSKTLLTTTQKADDSELNVVSIEELASWFDTKEALCLIPVKAS